MSEIEQCTAERARQLTDQIKVGVEAVWHLITEAYTTRAWSALGYRSWDDYCTREFGTSRLRLPREERAEVVQSLRESGLSLRAIASATGDSARTVRRALDSGGANAAPDDHRCDNSCRPDDHHVEDAEVVEPAPTITGTDGKQYQPKQPQPAPRRQPLSGDAYRASEDLKRAIKRVGRVLDDDRYRANRDDVHFTLRASLQFEFETLDRITEIVRQELDALTQGEAAA